MPVPLTAEQFLELIKKSSLVEPERLDAYVSVLPPPLPPAPELAARMIADGLLTNFQKEQLLQGKWRGYNIGKYRVLERLGSGGMGSVYLCEHQRMKNRVAVKVLPTAKAADPAALGRFYREARAAGVLDHPNLVRAHDIDQDGELHYLVMDYVDGVNLQHLVARSTGPLPYDRACNLIWQAALGLQHASDKGLVHRDIKPANLLLERGGTLKILDMGLARFLDDNKDMLTLKYDDNNVLGTADYVSPEQAMDSHEVDIRTDIYSLGATFYFLLTGRPLFPEGRVAQKLIWHQTREPAPIRQFRPDIAPELEVVVEKMLAKSPGARYQTPAEVVAALEPWVQTPVAPPSDEELPNLSPAARPSVRTDGEMSGRTPPRSLVGAATNGGGQRRPNQTVAQRPGTVSAFTLPPDSGLRGPATGGPGSGSDSDQPRTADSGLRPSDFEKTPRVLASNAETHRVTTEPPRIEKAEPKPTVAPPPEVVPPRQRGRFVWLLLTLFVGGGSGFALRQALRPASPPADAVTCPGRVLIVDRSKAEGTYPSIRAALEVARAGDCVRVTETTWDEVLRVESGELGRGVTVEGTAEGARPVLWQAPADRRELSSLIHLSAVRGLRLRNFTLDGRGVTQHLATISGPSPGLVLEDVKLTGFRQSGVRLTSGAGETATPIQLLRLQIQPEAVAEAGVLLDALSDQPCRQVCVRECQLGGQLVAGVVLAGPTAGVEVVGCKFVGLSAGVVYRKGAVPAALRLTLAGNEFKDLREAALHLETPPPPATEVGNSALWLTDNRFTRVKVLAKTDGFRSEPLKTSANWIWAAEGTGAVDNKVCFRKRFQLENTPTRAVLSVVADGASVVWVNGQRVGEAGLGTAESRGAGRVQAFDVARHLQQGTNVIAIEVVGGKRPAVLAELLDNTTGVLTPSLTSDSAWKAEVAQNGSRFQSLLFDDNDWKFAQVVSPYGQGEPAWRGLVWDALVQEQFKYQAGQVFPTPTGNQRDAGSPEGFPLFEAAVKE